MSINNNNLQTMKALYTKLVSEGEKKLVALNKVFSIFYGYNFVGTVKNILTFNNAKTVKGEKYKYKTAILYLSPANTISHTLTVCPLAELAGCKFACLNTAGRGQMNSVQAGRQRKTLLFFLDPELFMTLLKRNLVNAKKRALKEGYRLAVRLNGTSDIQWENTGLIDAIVTHGAVPYDYTKIPKRLDKIKMSSYHLTLSYSRANKRYQDMVEKAMVTHPEVNVAVVFRKELPKTFLGREVICGDNTDLRFLDPKGVVIGLTAKGKAKKDTSGFVVDILK
jgi:hypothetical protein